MLKAILAVAVVAASGWSAWWWVGSRAYLGEITNWVDARKVDGWTVQYDDLGVVGFPNRFDTVLEDFEISDGRNWRWTGPEFQMLALSYAPQNLILVWPGQQQLELGANVYTLEGEPLRASLQMDAASRQVTSAIFEAVKPELTNIEQRRYVAEKAVIALSQDRTPENTYRFGLEVGGLSLPPETLSEFSAKGVLPARIQKMYFDAHAQFAVPLSPDSLEWKNPNILAISLRSIEASWGALGIKGRGDLVADPDGYAQGRVDLELTNWREMIDVAIQSGAVDENVGSTLKAGLSLYATISGSGKTLDIPLQFNGGDMSLGPIKIGSAPRLNAG